MKPSAITTPAQIEPLESRQMLNAGGLDTSFGTSGKLSNGNLPAGVSVAVQSDGKIVVAGSSKGEFTVSRFNYDGTLDTTFGAKGTVSTLVGTSDVASAVAIDSSGRIVVVGTATGVGLSSGTDFAVLRYTTAGLLDRKFDNTGIATTSFGGNDVANALTLSGSGAIYVAGSKLQDGGFRDFAVARYTTAGTLDSSFGSGGERVTDLGADDVATAIAVSGSQVVVAGTSTNGTATSFAVARFDGNGNLDTSFNGTGEAFGPAGFETETVGGVVIQSNKEIVVGGEHNDIGTVFRFTSSGVLDTSYGDQGKQDFNGGQNNPGNVSSGINGLTLESDGKVLAAGFFDNNGSFTFALARFTTTGLIDSTFGNPSSPVGTRVVTTAFADNSGAAGVAFSPDGKIVAVGGATETDIARYNNDVLGTDTTAPKAALTTASRLRRATTRGYTFTVTYTDNVAININTVNNNDILVTGPNGFSELATLVSATPNRNDAKIVATYSLAAPRRGFVASANGVYTVKLQHKQLRDTNANAAAGGKIGAFTVAVP